MRATRRQFLGALGAAPALIQGAPGFIHTENRGGAWWLIDQRGKPFFSLGVNHVEPHLWLGDYNRRATIERYGADFAGPDGEFNPTGAGARRWMANVLGTAERMGFNTLGMHTHPVIPHRLYSGRIVYVVSLETAPISSWRQKQHQGPFPDIFAPAFERALRARVAEACRAHAANRNLLGYFYTDLPWWALNEGDQRAMNQKVMIHPWVNEILRMPAGAPGKQKWIGLLRARYQSAADAARVFGVRADSWEELAAGTNWFAPEQQQEARRASEEFIQTIAERWHNLHYTEIRRHDPSHLILGDKLQPPPDWLLPIVKRYVDVNVLQWRGPWPDMMRPEAERLYRATGKPVLLGDSSFSFLRPQQRQNDVKGWKQGIRNYEDMGRAYHDFLEAAAQESYVVGWHHCGFIEQWDGSRRGDVSTNENGLLDPFEKIDPALEASVARANAGAVRWHSLVAADLKSSTYFPPPDTRGCWRTLDSPERIRKVAGISVSRLDQAFEYTMRTSAHGGLLVARHGWLVYERYFGRAAREVTPNMFSVGKCFTSVCCGIMLDEHRDRIPQGLEQKVFTEKYLPEAFPLSDPRKAGIKLGHLLAMTSGMGDGRIGIVKGEVKELGQPERNPARDQDLSALRERMWTEPGGGYCYSTQGTHVASIVLRHIVGMEMQQYIDEKLAKPMQFGGWGYATELGAVRLPHTPGGFGVALRATDALRFAYLMLHGGRWGARQLVPAGYVEACRRVSPYNPHCPFSLQFQVNADGQLLGVPRDAFFKSGAGGFCIYAIPSLDLVVYKMASGASGYDLGFGARGQKPNESRDAWKPRPATQFDDGPINGDAGTRRTLEMVVAAILD